MNMNKRLMLTLGTGGASDVFESAYETGAVGFYTDKEACLASVSIGAESIFETDEYVLRGTGINENGKTVVRVRIHGANWLDGKELVRIMKKIGSPAYVGDYDSEHFILRPSAGASQLVDQNHVGFGEKVYQFYAEALIEEDLGADARASGIYFTYIIDSQKTAIKLASGSVGTQVLSGSSNNIYITGLAIEPTADDFDLIVRSASVRLTVGSASRDIPYSGSTIDFPVSHPLFSAGYVSDTLDAVSGIVTRRVGVYTFDESSVITSAVYNGMLCLQVELPRKGIGGTEISSCYFRYTSYLEYNGDMIISPDGDYAYFYAGEDMSDSEFIEEIVKNRVNFAYRLDEEYTEDTGVKLPTVNGTGQMYAEVCSPIRPQIVVKYKV